jgi:hypothetical protein
MGDVVVQRAMTDTWVNRARLRQSPPSSDRRQSRRGQRWRRCAAHAFPRDRSGARKRGCPHVAGPKPLPRPSGYFAPAPAETGETRPSKQRSRDWDRRQDNVVQPRYPLRSGRPRPETGQVRQTPEFRLARGPPDHLRARRPRPDPPRNESTDRASGRRGRCSGWCCLRYS